MAKQEMATTTTNPRSKMPGFGRRVILLVAPVHDELTAYTAGLLENPPELGAPNVLCRPESSLAYDELLSQLAIDPSETEVGLVFCGHGREDSLLGPGAPGDAAAFSPFFDQRHVLAGPKFLLAFCSNAAAELGAAYERRSHGRTFVGFEDEIGLVMKGGIYAESWKRILFGSVSAMLSTPDASTLEKSVLGLYRDVLSLFSPERDQKYRWGFMMRAYLRHQMSSISFIRT
jgi:hypothetical protein